MPFDYFQTAQEADQALREAGAVVSITWTPAPATDAPDAVQPDPVVVEAYGVVLDYNARQVGAQADSLIRAGDRQILLSALTVTGGQVPDIPFDALATTAGGRLYKVANCKMLEPAGVPVLVDLNVRK